jgi:hypothetical protein
MKHKLKHLKSKCAACERPGREMNKEHVFPRWLILRTNTHNTGIRWGELKRLPALKATIPLCTECNKILGKELEEPVSKLFDEIESHQGISDLDAELLMSQSGMVEIPRLQAKRRLYMSLCDVIG